MKLFWKLCGDHKIMKQELTDWLDTQTITSDNIGAIRRLCFVPWDSEWNGIVRNETAARENMTAQKLKSDDSWIALLVWLSPFIAAIVISIIHGLIT